MSTSEAEKNKTFRIASFGGEKFPDEKCVFLGVHAERKHRKLKFCDKLVRKLDFCDNQLLYVCFSFL